MNVEQHQAAADP